MRDHRLVQPARRDGRRHRGARGRFAVALALTLTICLAAATEAHSSPGRAEHLSAKRRPAAATVWAVGDAYPGAAARRLARLVRRARPHRLLYLGDVYETGTAAEYASGYDPLYGPLAARTIPTIGNHEFRNRATGYGPYWSRRRGRPMPSWLTTRVAGWDILMLNSEAPHGRGSAQLRWLRRATRRTGTCRLALTHRPRFSTGWHGDQPDIDPLWQALRGRARLLLSGHDHDLQRLADRNGIRQIVSGAGGRPNIPLTRRSSLKLRFADRTPPGAVRLRLSPGRATIDFVDDSGRLLDRSRVRCRRLRG